MIISIPIVTQVVSTTVVESLPIYDEHATYADKALVQYDPLGGTDYAIYGVFNETQPHAHHTFVYYSETAPNAVTDGMNYSQATEGYQMEYVLLGEGKFDTIALGRLMADSVSIEFIDPTGKVLFSLADYPIDNRIDKYNRHAGVETSEIFYCPMDMPHGSTIKLILKRPDEMTTLGTTLLGLSIEAGLHHLLMDDALHDRSPTEEDQWGHILYHRGTIVNEHIGTVDVPHQDKKMIIRMMRSIGGEEVIINSASTKHNKKPTEIENDTEPIKMIGRLKDFKFKTRVKNKRLDDYSVYTIKVREII